MIPRLRDFLQQRLPEFMIPSAFVQVPALPRTPSGKLDRRQLPAPHQASEPSNEFVPPRTPLEQTLAGIWCAVLGLKQVGIRDNFFDLGGHSLLAVRLVAHIEKAFGRRLPLATLFKKGTIEYLADNLQQAGQPGRRTEIVEIQPQGSKLPLVFLPTLVGEVMYCHQVARHLGPDQPVYGIQQQCGNGKTRPLTSLEAIASQCAEDLCLFQPHGPYYLAGYSFAGRLAFEMARQLSERGSQVNLLAIIDTSPSRPPTRSFLQRFRQPGAFLRNLPYWFIYDFLRTHPREMIARLRRKIQALRGERGSLSHLLSHSSQQLELEHLFDIGAMSTSYREMLEANLQAFREYSPKPYPGRITLLRARARPLFRSDEPDLGWGKLAAGGVEVKTVPGNHSSILQEPFVQTLARLLQAALDREMQPEEPLLSKARNQGPAKPLVGACQKK